MNSHEMQKSRPVTNVKMTTLSCLVAWLLLYLFAVSSLSLCSIGGQINDDVQDGLAIGQSSENAKQIPDVGRMIQEERESEGKERDGADEDNENTAEKQDPHLSQTIVQDDQNGQLTSQDPSSKNEILEQIDIVGDSFEDAVGEKNNGQLESNEEIEGSPCSEDKERERESVLPDSKPDLESDPTTDLPDTERSSQVKQHDNSGDDEDSNNERWEDTNPQEGTHIVKDETEEQDNSNGDVASSSDEMDKREGSNLIEDPNLSQTTTGEEDLVDSVNNKDQDEQLDDIKTEDVNKKTEDEGTNASADYSESQNSGEKLVGEDGTASEDEKKDISIEKIIRESGEKDDVKRTEDEEEKREDTLIIDQQINEKTEEKGKDENKEEKGEVGDEETKLHQEENEDEQTKSKVETDYQETKSKVEADDEETKSAEKTEDKEITLKVETDNKEIESREKTEDKDTKPKEENEVTDTTSRVDADDQETKPKVDAEDKETNPNVTDADVIKTEEMPSYDEWRVKKLQQAQEDFDRELGQGERNTVSAPKFNLNENSKNHASADCGAKILGNNPEAQSASAILNINRDIYMINPCSAKSIWFIVELCEPIQVKLIELANYELFSCVPESFKVSISDRYPVREWHLLGTFVARDERTLQNFPLNEETMFAKYMKIEMLTFFGSEHFCPLSVLRVFGTSMVEEIDDAEGVNSAPSTEQDVLPVHPTPLAEDLKSNGILDHAKDAVFKFVEKAAKVLTGSKSDTDAYSDNMTDGTIEEMLIDGSLPDDIRDDANPQDSRDEKFNDTHNDKCNGQDVCFQENYSITSQHCCLSLFAQTAGSILICCKALKRGSKPVKSDEETGEETPKQLPMEVIQTKMDDTQATIEGNIQTSIILEPTPAESYHGGEERIKTSSPPVLILSTKASMDAALPSETLQSDIVATRSSAEQILRTPIEQTQSVVDEVKGHTDTSHKEGQENEANIIVAPTLDSLKDENTIETSFDVPHVDTATAPTNTNETKDATAPHIQTNKKPKSDEMVKPAEKISEKDTAIANAGQGDTISSSQKVLEAELNGNASEQLKDNVPQNTADAKEDNDASKTISTKVQEPKDEMNGSNKVSSQNTPSEKAPSTVDTNKTMEVGNGSSSPSASSLSGLGPLPHGIQKESVLMRLNNRIKTLEINMSLSGLYLEELSQRYRKQMDEMQKAFNTKMKTVQENAQNAQEVRQQQAEHIQHLEEKLEKMRTDLVNVTLRTEGILREVVERHLFLMLCEVVVMVILFTYCLRRSQSAPSIDIPVGKATKSSGKKPVEDVGRRNSDGLLHVPMRDRITLSPGLGMELGMMKNSTNSNTGSLDDLLIIGPTTPLREALRQASEPSKQKNRNKNKGRHKNPARPASSTSAASNENVYQGLVSSSSSSNSSLASTFSLSSTSSFKGLLGATSSKHSTAGLLFRGSGQVKRGPQGGQSKQGTGGRGASQPLQRGAPENVGQVNGVYQGGKSHGVNGYSGAGSGAGSKKNNQCLNNNGKR